MSPFLRELPPAVYDEIVLRRASASGTTIFKDDFFEEDAIDIESNNPSLGIGEDVGSDWKKKSFLGDY